MDLGLMREDLGWMIIEEIKNSPEYQKYYVVAQQDPVRTLMGKDADKYNPLK